MRLFFLFSFLSFSLFDSLAQSNVQWADSLISFSSQLRTDAFSAKQVLGPPSSDPALGQSTCTWVPKLQNNESDDYIEVSFKKAQKVRQIFIVESMNPGAVFEIYLYDTSGKRNKVFQQVPKVILPKDSSGRIFRVPIKETSYDVNRLRLVLMTQNVPGYNLIDAIGISDDSLDYDITIEIIPESDKIGTPENLGKNINSSGYELAPVISPDGTILYFTRQEHPDNVGDSRTQDIWYAKKLSDDSFGPSINIGAPINNARSNALCGVMPDGQLLLMNRYLPDGNSEQGLSISYKKDENWIFPEPVDIENIYNRAKTGEYSLGADGKTIVMAVKRDDSYGLKDLYVSFKGNDGRWTEPKNLGIEINSGGDEIAPFLGADGRTIYFSSDGRPGYGSLDVFVSKRLDESWTKWTKPLNMGPILNSNAFDAYYSIPASGNYAYFTSSANSFGKSDIFRVELPVSAKPDPVILIKGRIYNAKTEEPLEAFVSIESINKGVEVGIARSNTLGEYSIVLPKGDVYGFLGYKMGFLSISQNLDLKDINGYEEIVVDLKLTPLEEGAVIRLNNLFFDYNKYDIKPENELELKRVLSLMIQYPAMEIEISGHTDNIGSDLVNNKLSTDRANAVKNYLISNGISGKRILSVGFGKNNPVADNKTEEGRAMNRRIEMKILKIQ